MNLIPKYQQAPLDAGGLFTLPWWAWLQAVNTALNTAGSDNLSLAAEIAAIATALGSPDGTVANIPDQDGLDAVIYGDNGIQITGTLASGSVGVLWRGGIANLSDVDLTGLADTNVLKWNATTEMWEPGAASADIAALTHAATSKATPVDADELPLVDSAASWTLKKLTLANLWGYIAGKAVTAGSAVVSFVKYNGTTQADGQWDGGSTAPTHTTRLNYDGYLYATRMYGDGSNLTGIAVEKINLDTVPNAVQTLIANGGWLFYLPNPNANSSTIMGFDGTLSVAVGTGAAVNITNTNTYSRQPRRRYSPTSSAAGSSCGSYHSAAYACLAGGLQYTHRFGIADPAAVANARLFAGFRDLITAPPNTDPSSWTNIIGVGGDTGDTNLQVMHNDASGTATKIDLGANFPINTRETDWFQFQLLVIAGSGQVQYHVRNVTNSVTAQGVLTTNLPSATTLLARCEHRNNGTTALTVRIETGGYSFQINRE